MIHLPVAGRDVIREFRWVLTKIFLKVTQSIRKVFQKISEISLDKFEMIWSMEKRRES